MPSSGRIKAIFPKTKDYREATEEDLQENHHLETLGELIEYADIGIECCPFCGQKLDENREAEKRAQVSFSYVDCSKWS